MKEDENCDSSLDIAQGQQQAGVCSVRHEVMTLAQNHVHHSATYLDRPSQAAADGARVS